MREIRDCCTGHVHHKNENSCDNRVANLQLFESQRPVQFVADEGLIEGHRRRPRALYDRWLEALIVPNAVRVSF